MPDPELLREWHPLDHTPAPEYIPPQWDGPHVGKRLAQALRTLRYMPINGYPRPFGNSWPTYQIEWSDALAQLEADETQQERDARAKNWTRIISSAAEIAHMETAIVWPARYLRHLPQLLLTVQAVAITRARDRDIAHGHGTVLARTKAAFAKDRGWNSPGSKNRCAARSSEVRLPIRTADVRRRRFRVADITGSYSITSSARSNTVRGTERLRVLAVSRLSASSYLLGV